MKELHAFPMKSNYSSVAYNLAVLGGSRDGVDLLDATQCFLMLLIICIVLMLTSFEPRLVRCISINDPLFKAVNFSPLKFYSLNLSLTITFGKRPRPLTF